jgi:hypothetical protein
MVGTFSQRFACVASEPNGVEYHGFMKPSSWDKQLGLASPLKCAAIQSGQTNNPSMDKDEAEDEVGLDASHHIRIFLRGGEKCFFLTSSLQKLALRHEFPQAEVQVSPPVSGVSGFAVDGIVLRSTQSLCRRTLDRT